MSRSRCVDPCHAVGSKVYADELGSAGERIAAELRRSGIHCPDMPRVVQVDRVHVDESAPRIAAGFPVIPALIRIGPERVLAVDDRHRRSGRIRPARPAHENALLHDSDAIPDYGVARCSQMERAIGVNWPSLRSELTSWHSFS